MVNSAFSLPPSTARPKIPSSSLPPVVLLITKDPTCARAFVTGEPESMTWTQVDDVETALMKLAENAFDCIVFDRDVSEKPGLSELDTIHEHAPWSGLVVLTSGSAHELSFEAIRRGAQECLSKASLDARLLGHAVRYAVDRKWLEAFVERREQLLDGAFRAIQPLAIVDSCGSIVVVNRAWEDLAKSAGFDPSRVGVGASYFEFLERLAALHPAAEPSAAGVRATLEGRTTSFQHEFSAQTAAGLRWYVTEAHPMVATGGVVVTHTDITDRKLAEESLRRAAFDLRRLLDLFPEYVGIHSGGRFVYANQGLTKSLGFDRPEQILGSSIYDIVHPDERDAVRAHLGSLPKGSESSEPSPAVERRWLRADGSIFEVEVTVLPVHFDGRDSVLVIARDLEQRRQVNARMMQMDRMLSVGLMAAGIGHEINNPLSLVTANVDLALRSSVDLAAAVDSLPSLRIDPETLDLLYKFSGDLKEIRESLSDARLGARRVQTIVNDLRTFARPQTETDGPIQIEGVIQAALNMATNEIRHRARLVKDYAPVRAVIGNEARLGQVFLNLLTNAAHAIPIGAADRNEIRIRIYPSDGGVVVEIADTGAGISDQDLPRIFEPFFTTKPIGQGTGLGLAICRNIVLSQGGSIDVQSEVGRGTTFRVRLPAAHEPPRERMASSISPLAHPARALRILVVDDEELIGRVVRRCLGRQNMVVWAGSGREGLDLLESNEEFDAVFLDVMMPDMTGIELYERIAQTRPDKLAKIAFLTGGAFTQKAREFLERVPNVQIMKPFEARLLRTVAEELAQTGQ